MLDFLRELSGVAAPICIIWGDQDYVAPADVLTAYRDVAARMPNVELHIIPGVLHSYMMRRNVAGFDSEARTFSMTRALAILDLLRQTNASAAM
jgi:carboxymethylenebutenolidase